MSRRLSPLEAANTNRIKFNFLKKLRQKRRSELGMYNTNIDHEVLDYLPSINHRAELKMKERLQKNSEILNSRIFKQVVASKTKQPGIVETPEIKKSEKQ